LGNFHGISVVIMVINVVIRQARVTRPTSCKPRVLYRPILIEDLYMEFILFIYLICFINLLFYFTSMTTFVMIMMEKPYRSFKFWTILEQSGNIVDFKIIEFFLSFWHFCVDYNDTFTEIVRILFILFFLFNIFY